MTRNAKIKMAQRAFLEAMKKKFSEDPTTPSTKTFTETKKGLDHVTLFAKQAGCEAMIQHPDEFCVHLTMTANTNKVYCELSENEQHTWYNLCQWLIDTGRCKHP